MRLLLAHLRSGAGTSVFIGLLVAATVLVVALAPRALQRLGDDELGYELGTEPPGRIDLVATTAYTVNSQRELDLLDAVLAERPSLLPEPLAAGAGELQWMLRGTAERGSIATLANGEVSLRVAVDLRWLDRIRFVSGAAPGPWPTEASASDGADAAAAAPLGIALAQASADELGATVGDVIETPAAAYRITGIYEAADPADPFWSHADDLLGPAVVREAGQPLTVQLTAFATPDAAGRLAASDLLAWIPIAPGAFAFADAEVLADQAREVAATPVDLPNGPTMSFRSSLDDVIDAARERVAAMSALIALSASGFHAVLVAAYALCIQTVLRRRRAVLALASARGAAPRQVRGVMVIEALAIVVPAAAIALVAAALLLPGPVGWTAWIAPLVVALVPVALAAALANTSVLRERRDDLGSHWTGPRRWVIELAVVLLAVAALVLLQRRGLVASSAVVGIDPLLSAVPVLLAVVAGLLVLRLLPAPLAGVHRLTERGRAAASAVGSARAVREPAVGLIGTLALITGLSIAVFTTVMISTVSHGLVQAAKDELGADLQIAARDLPAGLVDELEGIPGVTAAVALVTVSGVEFADEAGPRDVTVVLADTAALHAVREDLPALGDKADGALPILVSADWANRIEGSDLSLVNTRVSVEGVVPANALPGMSRTWLLADASATDELGLSGQVPRRILVAIVRGADAAAIAESAAAIVTAEQPAGFEDTVRVDDAQTQLARTLAAPATAALNTALVVVSAGTLLLTMLIVALAALSAAARRARVVGILRVLGMDRAGLRSLVAWEFAPVALAAVVVGTALGLALPYLVTAVLDLRGFLGGNAPPQPVLEPLWIAGVVAAFVVAVTAAVLIATAAGRRLNPAGVLKMGDA